MKAEPLYRFEAKGESIIIFLYAMSEIKAIIFDWGGVLADDPAPGLMQYCADKLSVSKEDYTKAHNRFAKDFQKGLISEENFWAKVCRALDKPTPRVTSLWSSAFRSVYSPRTDVFFVAWLLHNKGYRTALLSNTEVPTMRFFHELKYDMFDVLVFSCAEGTMKPGRKIYEITLERLGTTPEQTIFIDDKQEFINAAKQIKINTILFKDIEQVKNKLAQFSIQTV
jgi:putative hydrolase of the HAD superfamily